MGVLSADQVKVFLAIVECGSFGKAARRLHRHQSAISYAISNLESQLGVDLFNRSEHKSTLTPAGHALVAEARNVSSSMDALRERAKSFSRGIEPELVIAIDSFCPLAPLEPALDAFATEFPMVKLVLRNELVAVAVRMIVEQRCTLGIISHPASSREGLRHVPLNVMLEIGAYAAARHPLAQMKGRISDEVLIEYLQLMVTEESDLVEGMKCSARTWHSNDFRVLASMLRAGVGWSFMPKALVAAEVEAGTLVNLDLAVWPEYGLARMQMMGVCLPDTSLGPAATWLLRRLSEDSNESAQAD